MSFSNNCKPERMPGPIVGNPLNGLTDRASIQVQKIFDACMKQETLTDEQIVVSNLEPSTFTAPLTFVSAKSTTDVTGNNLTVIDVPDSKCCSRVAASIVIPLTVVMLDANGTQVVGTSEITIPKDILMCLTQGSVTPSRIVAEAYVISPNGRLITTGEGTATFAITACVTTIMKVIMDVQLLVPTYGYTYIPPCQEYSQDVCDGVFDLPLYPRECGKDNCNM